MQVYTDAGCYAAPSMVEQNAGLGKVSDQAVSMGRAYATSHAYIVVLKRPACMPKHS